MTQPLLDYLSRDIEDARQHFLGLVRRLDSLLRHYAPGITQPAWWVLDCAEEFGDAHAFKLVATEPERFRLEGARRSSDLAAVGSLLSEALVASHRLDSAMRLREDAYRQRDPERPQVMIHQGRDFTFDVATRQWRYLDQPEIVYTLLVDRVPNRMAPEPDPTPSPRRSRRMSS